MPQDAAEAVRWYRLAAEQGLASAQHNLGFMYANGTGVPQDDAEAARWVRLAAEQGLAVAQFNLGSWYGTGAGVAQDDAEAARWYRLAAEQGDAVAQGGLGFMYANGTGVSPGRRRSRAVVPAGRRAGPRLGAVQPRVQVRQRDRRAAERR